MLMGCGDEGILLGAGRHRWVPHDDKNTAGGLSRFRSQPLLLCPESLVPALIPLSFSRIALVRAVPGSSPVWLPTLLVIPQPARIATEEN